MLAAARINQINLHVFDYKLRTGVARYSVILVISLILAHLSRQQVPFTQSYSFPLSSLVNFLIFGFIVCTSSWIITNLFKHKIFNTAEIGMTSIARFLAYNLAGVLIIYTILYTSLFYSVFDIVNYSTFLLVCWGVVVVENSVYLLYGVIQFKVENPIASELTSLLVPTGTKHLRVELDTISHARIDNGLVVIYTTDRKKVTSQFNTLDQLEAKLPTDRFYRANRQVIIHRNSVKQIIKGVNRKLTIQINEYDSAESISVSRYKNKEFIAWISQG